MSSSAPPPRRGFLNPFLLFDHLPKFANMLDEYLDSPGASRTCSASNLRIPPTDKQLGFQPIARRPDYDLEASLILGDILRSCSIVRENGLLPCVRSRPEKSELREIARMPKEQGWIKCMGLVSKPDIGRTEGEAIWEKLEMFRVSKEERKVMGVARGWRCFTEVPAEMAGCARSRRAIRKTLKEKGNVEKDGQVLIGFQGTHRKKYGRVIGSMPVIQEEEEGEEGAGEADDEGEGGKQNGGFNDSGVCLVCHLPRT